MSHQAVRRCGGTFTLLSERRAPHYMTVSTWPFVSMRPSCQGQEGLWDWNAHRGVYQGLRDRSVVFGSCKTVDPCAARQEEQGFIENRWPLTNWTSSSNTGTPGFWEETQQTSGRSGRCSCICLFHKTWGTCQGCLRGQMPAAAKVGAIMSNLVFLDLLEDKTVEIVKRWVMGADREQWEGGVNMWRTEFAKQDKYVLLGKNQHSHWAVSTALCVCEFSVISPPKQK